ncbi:AraC family transcriptional regulator [Mesorhizobium sp. KR1-2]|uniref:AraC family transcriptional regulator n=1 Tax=Mesorhizobium sp. KR1-2 TaxID=3156609 RepID=UPI0032B3D92E
MSDRRDRQSGSGFRRISTDDLQQSDRFDYWRSLFPRIDLDLTGTPGADGFSGQALLCADAQGAIFGYSANAGTVVGQTRGDSDFIMIGATVAGETRVRRGHGAAVELTAQSGIGIYDASQPLRTHARDHAHIYISLPRATVIEDLEGDVEFLQEGAFCLPQVGLSRSLNDHLRMMARDAAHLDQAATKVAMQIAVDLALGILASEQATRIAPKHRDHAEEFHARALQFIHLHYADPSLVAATIAYSLGCSRAHLYRLFAQRGQSVGDVIRTVRVARASSLLKATPPIPLARIAMLCGYESLSGLTRAFARETGTTPARLREDRES